jgi:hypothetical protein
MTSNDILPSKTPKTKFLVYKTTNLINGKIYVGVHACSCKDCKYMGSGPGILRAIKKYGKKNFKRDILFECYNEEEMLAKEADIVNEEFILNENNYNLTLGGICGTKDRVTVKDENNNFYQIKKDDERFTSKQLVGVMKNKVTVKDKQNKTFSVNTSHPDYLSGKLVHIFKGTVIAKNKTTGEIKHISSDVFNSKDQNEWVGLNENKIVLKDKNGICKKYHKNDPRRFNGELQHVSTGLIAVKDNKGDTFSVQKDDARYLSGELNHVAKGRISVINNKGDKFSVFSNDPRYLSGELKGVTIGYATYYDKDGKKYYIEKDSPLIKELSLVHKNKNKVVVKDKNGNILQVDKNDPMILSGELTNINKGKISVIDKNGKTFKVHKNDPRYLSGELKGISFGSKMMTSPDGEKKLIMSNKIKEMKLLRWKLKNETF